MADVPSNQQVTQGAPEQQVPSTEWPWPTRRRFTSAWAPPQLLEMEETSTGRRATVELAATLPIEGQSWFWTREWQEGEAQAQEDIRQGRVAKFDTVDDLIHDLKK